MLSDGTSALVLPPAQGSGEQRGSTGLRRERRGWEGAWTKVTEHGVSLTSGLSCPNHTIFWLTSIIPPFWTYETNEWQGFWLRGSLGMQKAEQAELDVSTWQEIQVTNMATLFIDPYPLHRPLECIPQHSSQAALSKGCYKGDKTGN